MHAAMELPVGNMILSRRNEKNVYFVPQEVVSALHPYHFPAMRFLFDCFIREQQGAVLNFSPDMIFELQIAAFIRAISKDHNIPALIICDNDKWTAWTYYLKLYSKLNVFQLTQHNANNLFQEVERKIILVLEKDLKYLQDYVEHDFFLICVENLDRLISARVTSKLIGHFIIGLTLMNPYKNRDPKLLWKMLKWVNPKKATTLVDFTKEDSQWLSELVEPYTDTWLRLTWKFGFEKPKEDELLERKRIIRSWCEDNDIISQVPKGGKKRKSSVKPENVAVNKKKGQTSNLNDIDETVIDEFAKDWPCMTKPKKTSFKRYRSDITHDKLIDNYVIEEFHKDFGEPKQQVTKGKVEEQLGDASQVHMLNKNLEGTHRETKKQTAKRKLQEEFGNASVEQKNKNLEGIHQEFKKQAKRKLQEEFGEASEVQRYQDLEVILGDVKNFFEGNSQAKVALSNDSAKLLDVDEFFRPQRNDTIEISPLSFKSDIVLVEKSERECEPMKLDDDIFMRLELSPLNILLSSGESVKETEVPKTSAEAKDSGNRKNRKLFESLRDLFPLSPVLSEDFADDSESPKTTDIEELLATTSNLIDSPGKKRISKESILISLFGEDDELVVDFQKKLCDRDDADANEDTDSQHSKG